MDSQSSEKRRHRSRSRDRSQKHAKDHKRQHRSTDESELVGGDLAEDKRRRDRGEDELEDRERRRDDKKRKRDKEGEKSARKREKQRQSGGLAVVDDDVEEDEWVEKDVDMDNTQSLSRVPTPASLQLHSNPASNPGSAPLPPSIPFDSTNTSRDRQREDWMLDPTSLTVPALLVNSASGHVAKSADAVEEAGSVLRSARVDVRDLGTPIKGSVGETLSSGMTDGFGEEDTAGRSLGGGVDFFSGIGTYERVKKAPVEKPDPSKLVISRKYELNTQLLDGKPLEEYTATEKKKVVPGSAGSQWRMMKLRRVYEQAEEESRSVEDVALERYGNMEDFEEAQEERQVLDDRGNRRSARRGGDFSGGGPGALSRNNSGFNTPGGMSDSGGSVTGNQSNSARRYVFTSDEAIGSRPSSRAGFKRPGENSGEVVGHGLRRSDSSQSLDAGMMTPTQPGRASGRFDPSKTSTPIPSVLTPHHLLRNPLSSQAVPIANSALPSTGDPTASTPPLNATELNKLQAKVLRAKLTGNPKAADFEAEYNAQLQRAKSTSGRAQGGGDVGSGLWKGGEGGLQGQQGRTQEGDTDVQVLPTLDGQGRLYDVGTGLAEEVILPGNRKPNTKKFETRDKDGNLLRINADDDALSLGELVRQERFSGGSKSQKDMDGEMAMAIANDTKYEADLDYVDDNVERLARRKVKSTESKKAFAVQDYARTKKALDTCPFCFNPEDGSPPKAAIVALGRRTYLSCTVQEELVDGHCLIVPMQHSLSTLELDDDDWDEIKNHMKCLMRMFAEQNQGVIFFETVMSLSHQKHTFIECIPLPSGPFADAPAYFRESILSAESEWSQNRKLIDFSARPGGFRRSMVANLPYFMVMWDYKGEKGWGHIIEGTGDAPGSKGMDGEDGGVIDEGDKGNAGGVFPRYFAAEIIGNILDLEPRKWRKPKRADPKRNRERASKLGNRFQKYNWTLELAKEDGAA